MIDGIKKLIEDKIREIGIAEEQSNDFGEESIVLFYKVDETYDQSFILHYSGFKKDEQMFITIRLKKDNKYLDEIPESFDGVEIIVLLN